MAWELLTRLKLAGKVVTGDALYAQREFSRYVVGRGGGLLLGDQRESA